MSALTIDSIPDGQAVMQPSSPLGSLDHPAWTVRFRDLADLAHDAFVIVAHDLSILDANTAFAELVSFDRSALIGQPLSGLLSEASGLASVSPPGSDQDHVGFPLDLVSATGEEIAVLASWAIVELDDGPHALLKIARDRSAMSGESDRLPEPQSDPLTGMLNRSSLDATIRVELSRAKRHGSHFAVLCLDLDGFKAINDSYGHAVGDQVLRLVASRIMTTIRDTDVGFRVGGDEFVIIQSHADQAGQSARLAERLIEAIGAPYLVDDFSLPLGVSVGIAHSPAHGDTVEDLLKRADAALYRAKREGKNTHRFVDPSMNDALQARRRIEAELRRVIDHGELALAYQPQVDLATARITTFEALLRWQGPRFGGIAEATFVTVVEEAGLMVAVGEWLIGQAFAEASRWPNALGLAVRLSSLQVRSSTLVSVVRDTLAACGLAPSRVVFEIPEPTIKQSGDEALHVLAELRALGTRIAVDNFGTGQASLSYLHSFPFDILKIDRSCIAAIDRDPRSAALVRSLLTLSRDIGFTVIADGVETEAQRAVLSAMRCNQIQGDLVGRPEPIEAYRQATGAGARLPESRAPVPTQAVHDLRRALPPEASVLLADDSQVMGEMIAVILRTLGFAHVDVVRDGTAALEHLRAGNYALVVSDWNMAPLNGIELLVAMRRDPALAQTPFLMLTANGRTGNRISATEAGADAFLVKPFRPDAFAARIADAMAGRRRPALPAVA